MPLNIDASYYKTGTATVAANGTAVTGQGTAWLQSVRAGDLFGTHVGDPVRIASVNSNTSLTLAYPWKGPAQTESAYEIQFTPYDTGYQAAVRELLQMLASGNVEALAGLEGGADKLPFFDGTGTMDQTALTALARTLLGRDDAAQMRDDIGANNASNLTEGTLETGRLPFSLGGSRAFDTATGVPNNAQWRTDNSLRWAMGKDGTPESGGNSGAHFTPSLQTER